MATLFANPRYTPLDAQGDPYPGATLTFYAAGTTTPQAVYTTSALTTPHPSPVTANSAGQFPAIYYDDALQYRALLRDQTGVLLWDIDTINSNLTAEEVGLAIYPRTTSEINAGVTPTAYRYPPLNVLRYGADPAGVASSLLAFQNAAAVSEAGYNDTIFVPHGVYRVDGTVTLKQGTMIVGPGSQGSTQQYGCTILHRSNSDCLVWDGSGASNAGSGGGAKNLLILKDSGFSGGRAIYLLATSNLLRPGEMMFENILSYGVGGGLWSRGLHVDGTAANTAGSRGVRTLNFNKVRFADCTTNDQYVYLNQAVHVHGNIDIDQGSGTGTVGMTIAGNWDNINLTGRFGNVVVDHSGTPGSDTPVLHLSGRASAVDVNYTSVIGSLNLRADSIANASAGLRVISSVVDAFFASRSSTVTNQTGNGTVATLVCDSEHFDKNSSYATDTGIFTAKCAGIYEFHGSVTLTSLSASATSGSVFFTHRDSGGTLKNSIEQNAGVGAMRTSGNQVSIQVAAILDVAEGDTVRVEYSVTGMGADTIGAGGAAGTRYSFFAGKLL